jgi:arginase family enzyme
MIDTVKVPISGDHTKSTRGAPDEILSHLKVVWSSETGNMSDNYTVSEWESWHNTGNRAVFIGGDHTVTSTTFPQTGADRLVMIDAHFDLHKSNRLCHGNWLRLMIEEGKINPKRVGIIGVRNWEPDELQYAEDKGIEYALSSADWIYRRGNKDGSIYLTIDIDGIDPAFAPGTGYMEPGGLTSREALEIVKLLRGLNLVAMDIVEVDPGKDINGMTSKLAAKLVKEFL